MQAFTVKRQNGVDTTTAIDQSLVKVFKDISTMEAGITAGMVNEGEIVSTIEDDRPHVLPIDQLRDLQEEIRELQEEQGSGVSDKISTNATSSDRCPAASEVTSEISSAISDEATARDTAITNAINGLDVASAGGTGKFIKAISQTDGKISATEGTLSMTLSGNDLYITFA